ncbi:MAG: helix-turn-helix domain-containing protein [Verrucomicrobiales bacterium]
MAVPFGKQLQDARLARDLSLEDVQFQTRIHHSLLAAMENDDLGAFPNPTYARKFFAAYARHVGIDAAAFLDRFHPASLSGVVQYHPYLQKPADRVGPLRPPPPYRPAPHSTALAIVLTILALTAAAVIGVSLRHRANPPLTPSPPDAALPSTTPAGADSRKNQTRPAPPPAYSPPDLPVLRASPVEEASSPPAPNSPDP